MILTSAQASKLLRRLNDELESLEEKETRSSEFLAALGEDPESVRPPYDYAGTQEQISEVQKKIRKLRHAVNLFNTSHKVEGFDMTVDEILVFIPQLTKTKAKLASMKGHLPKERAEVFRRQSNIIDYRYSNYDIPTVEQDYLRITDLLAKAQTALDKLNQTETFSFDF